MYSLQYSRYSITVSIGQYGIKLSAYEGSLNDRENWITSCGVKWDGCSNFEFKDIHFCDRRGIERYNKLLLALYEIAYEFLKIQGSTLPEWDNDWPIKILNEYSSPSYGDIRDIYHKYKQEQKLKNLLT